jgi:hypothetical protein
MVSFYSKWFVKFIFPFVYKKLLHAVMWLKLPNGEGQGAKKEVVFLPIGSWIFTFFSILFFAHGFI